MTKDFYSKCADCKRDTFHKTLHSESIDDTSDYHSLSVYEIIQCLGCRTISFRHLFYDYENSYPDENDKWKPDIEINLYPKAKHECDIGNEVYILPDIVRLVYIETIDCINRKNYLIASMGLRTLIEAVCLDKKVKARNLSESISALAKNGLISKKDSNLLHGIRFMGNDAAHEIKKPKEEQIFVAVKIINHLIRSAYILHLESEGKLEGLLDNFEETVSILDKKLEKLSTGDEMPLSAIFSADIRRIDGGIKDFESKLIQKINSGEITNLKLGKMATYGSSPAPLQHFIVN